MTDKNWEELFDEKFVSTDKWGFEIVPADMANEFFIPKLKSFISSTVIPKAKQEAREEEQGKYFQESFWRVDVDEETGKHYWRGGCEGDMDETSFDLGEPLICNPEHFPEGFTITGHDLVNSLTQDQLPKEEHGQQ